MTTNEINAEIELKHIELELKYGRTQHFRHFIDQYYCYKHGCVTSGGKAKWEGLLFTGAVSVAARAAEENRKDLVKEHAIPLKFITCHLLNLIKTNQISTENIAKLIDDYFIVGTITKEEDRKLRGLNLSSRMPVEYFDPSSWLHGDPLARYRIANIALENP